MRATELPSDDYRDANTSLFQRRQALRAELDGMLDDEAVQRTRRVRMLRRQLDDVTTEIVTLNMGLVRSYTRRFSGAASADHRAEFEADFAPGRIGEISEAYADSAQWADDLLRQMASVNHTGANTSSTFAPQPATRPLPPRRVF